MLSLVPGLFLAGHETLAHELTNVLWRLLSVPERWRALVEDPKMGPQFFDEALRCDPSVYGMWRIATRDTVLLGQSIAAGQKLFLVYLAANRDEQYYSDADYVHARPRARRAEPRLRSRHPSLHRRTAGSPGGTRRPRSPGPASPEPASRRRLHAHLPTASLLARDGRTARRLGLIRRRRRSPPVDEQKSRRKRGSTAPQNGAVSLCTTFEQSGREQEICPIQIVKGSESSG